MKRVHSLRLSFQVKVAICMIAVVTVTSAVLISLLYDAFRSNLRDKINDGLINLVSVAASQIDGDRHAQVIDPANYSDEAYQSLLDQLRTIQASAPDVYYIYTMRM
ncbi:MAG TPA: hypothetical protein VFF68_12125, partial [Anaerolineaceae bacterium]|nr:hypothetical protein [Anaerolineaceae bacterium]